MCPGQHVPRQADIFYRVAVEQEIEATKLEEILELTIIPQSHVIQLPMYYILFKTII